MLGKAGFVVAKGAVPRIWASAARSRARVHLRSEPEATRCVLGASDPLHVAIANLVLARLATELDAPASQLHAWPRSSLTLSVPGPGRALDPAAVVLPLARAHQWHRGVEHQWVEAARQVPVSCVVPLTCAVKASPVDLLPGSHLTPKAAARMVADPALTDQRAVCPALDVGDALLFWGLLLRRQTACPEERERPPLTWRGLICVPLSLAPRLAQ